MDCGTVLYGYLNIGIRDVNFPQHEISRKIDAVEPKYNTRLSNAEHSIYITEFYPHVVLTVIFVIPSICYC